MAFAWRRNTLKATAAIQSRPRPRQRDRRLPAEGLRPVQAGDRDRPGREEADQEKAAQQQAAVHPPMSSQDGAVEPAQTLRERDADGNSGTHDREKEKDAGVGITT